MPLYEGIGLISERPPVILEIGSAYTKVGVAGEPHPHAIVPSGIFSKKSREFKSLSLFTSDDILLYDTLCEFLDILYFKHLLVNPKERNVVIVESPFTTSQFRNSLAKVLFCHFDISTVLYVCSHVAALFTCAISTGLIIDVGYEEATILPVYEGYPLLHAWQSSPNAGKAIHLALKNDLTERCMVRTPSREEKPLVKVREVLSETMLEDIKVRTCMVSPMERMRKLRAANEDPNQDAPPPPPNVEYPLDNDHMLLIKGRIRETACEVIFEKNEDYKTLANLIMEALIACPVDTRKILAENIFMIGGSAMLPGFKHRLLDEIKTTANSDGYKDKVFLSSFKVHLPPAKDNYVSWLGGSIIGATEEVVLRGLTKETYLKLNCVPDWSDGRQERKNPSKA